MRAGRNLITALTHGRTPQEALGLAVSAFFFVVSSLYCLLSWHDATYDTKLQQGRLVMLEMMQEEHLDKAGFFDEYPEAKPSQFVEFADSEAGDALWPSQHEKPRRDRSGPPGAREETRTTGPDDLAYRAFEPRPDHPEHQLVYSPLDDENKIKLRGYLADEDEPFYTWTEPFPYDPDAGDS